MNTCKSISLLAIVVSVAILPGCKKENNPSSALGEQEPECEPV